MNYLISGYWLTFNAALAILLYLSIRRIDQGNLRFFLVAFVTSMGLYANLLLIKWESSLGDSAPTLITRFIFGTAALMAASFGRFLMIFAQKRNHIMTVLQISLTAMALTCLFTDGIVVTVHTSMQKGRYVTAHGPLYLVYLSVAAASTMLSLHFFYRSMRQCTEEFYRFQMKSIFKTSILVSVGMLITNALVPATTGQSSLSVFGAFFPAVLFAVILAIIGNGQKIWLRQVFSDVISANPQKTDQNISAIREILGHVRLILAKSPKKIDKSVELITQENHKIQVNFRHRQEHAVDSAEAPTPAEYLKQLVTYAANLERENRRLILANVRAEAVITNLEDMHPALHGKQQAKTIHLNAAPKSLSDELEENMAQFEQYWGEKIVCVSPESFELFQQLERLIKINSATLIGGEPATGKATMCRCLHYRRNHGPLVEVAAFSHNTAEMAQIIANLHNSRQPAGLLIRNLDVLPAEGLDLVWQTLKEPSESIYFYYTCSQNFFSQIMSDSLLRSLQAIYLESIPLRKRKDDIRFMALYFCKHFLQQHGRSFSASNISGLDTLCELELPGNVAQLRNMIARCIADSPAERITIQKALPTCFNDSPNLSPLENAERNAILSTLRKNKYNKSRTRRELGISLNTLKARIQAYNIPIQELVKHGRE